MKKLFPPPTLSLVCAVLGVMTMVLRMWLIRTGFDGQGLLNTAHPANIVSWILTGIVVVLVFATVLGQKGRCLFPPQGLNAVGILFAALGFLSIALRCLKRRESYLELAAGIFAAVAVLCALLMAVNRLRRRRTHVLLSLPFILCFALLILSRYTAWSAEPDPQKYVWPLVGLVCVMIATYQFLAAQLGTGSSFNYLLFGSCGIFFCFGAAAGPENTFFYLTMAIWLLLDIRTLVIKLPKKPA